MRRWIIRGFFIGVLALCASGWVCSAGYRGHVSYGHYNVRAGIDSEYGLVSVFLRHETQSPEPIYFGEWKPFLRGGWVVLLKRCPEVHFWDPPTLDRRFVLGFYVYHVILGGDTHVRRVYVPYWFLLVVASVVLWLAWRKTRPAAKGFPVDAQASNVSGETTP